MKQIFRPAENAPGAEPARRWVCTWNLISIGIALFTTLYALVDQKNSLQNSLIIICFLLIYLAWYWAFILRLDRWGRNSRLLAVSFVVVMLFLAGMTNINGIYTFQLFSLYGIVFSVMDTGLAVPLSIILSALGAYVIIQRNHLALADSWGVIIGFSIAAFFSILMGLFISAIIRQSAERQQMIDELKAARADLAQAERQAGILEERQRMAREIHDTLAQGFTSIVMHLEAAEQALPNDTASQPVRQHLNRARDTARQNLAEARKLVWALRAEPLELESLALAIQRVAGRWAEETGISARVELSGNERGLPANYEVALLRTTQEALANIQKHAAAHQVNLTLTYMEDQVVLDVQDDGQGFDSSADPIGETHSPDGSGFGLIGMRERAEQLGGSLTIESAPGEGTTLMIELPLYAHNPSSPEAL